MNRKNLEQVWAEFDKITSHYKLENIDFNEVQKDKNNPLDSEGYPIYPKKLPATQGTSFTYILSDKLFFKRKMQDRNMPSNILSQHHQQVAGNELRGTFDDLGEVLCYILAKNIKNSNGEPIIEVAEYKLATYQDEKEITYRGCISTNVCKNKNQSLITMNDILSSVQLNGKSIDVYMKAIEHYCKNRKIKTNLDNIRRDLVKNSYFCWKVANSDNHKNNITFILEKQEDGALSFKVSPMIDNGSAYEFSLPFLTPGENVNGRYISLLEDDNFSSTNDRGERYFDFKYQPFKHTAFYLDANTLLFDDIIINGFSLSYELALASEMLSDKDLFESIYQVEKQFDLTKAIKEIDKTYGTLIAKQINWPAMMKEFMYATNDIKQKTLAYAVAEYYFYVAYSNCIEKVDRQKPTKQYAQMRKAFTELYLLESKESYDEAFELLASAFNVKIDNEKLKNLSFKKELFEKVSEKI